MRKENIGFSKSNKQMGNEALIKDSVLAQRKERSANFAGATFNTPAEVMIYRHKVALAFLLDGVRFNVLH